MSGLVERLRDYAMSLRERSKEWISSEQQPAGMMAGLLSNDIAKTFEESAERIEELEARVKELEGNIIATDKEYPAYGCHVDALGKPDECVIDLGRPQDCFYAKGRADKTTCEYWQPCF